VTAALAAGCRWVSLREKDLLAGEQIACAGKLLPLAHRFGARFTIHGDIAAATMVDGVHLPESGDARAARERLGPGKLIGLSVHTPDQAKAADPSALDYLIAGPVFETASKPGYGPTLGAKGLAEFVQATILPIIAIGGIDAANIAEVMRAGATGVAVMGAIMRASDPRQTTRGLIAALERARDQRPR
jgi:thiamine-phosphate pyrophosphorylase